MARDKLVWVNEYDADEPMLDYAIHWREEFTKPSDDATLEQLADFCDMKAESANYHDFVGLHRWLAVVLFKTSGRDKATELMRTIAEYGGLEGVSQDHEAFKEMNVSFPWKDWAINE